jgi:putative sigma-54 modulation protein
MKTIINGKNIEITEGLRERVTKKISKLNRFFDKEAEAHVTLSVQKLRQTAELTISYNGIVLRSEESNEDMYVSIDKAVDLIERQIRKNKTRLEKRLYENDFRVENFTFNEDISNEDIPEEKEFKVVRSKRFAIKPMDVEEAILQMNLIGHEFFMFFNADTNHSNVVYKRKDGNYGLIEPEF